MAYSYPIAPVGAIFLETCRSLLAGQRILNTFHWRLEANPQGATVATVADLLHAKHMEQAGMYTRLVLLCDENLSLQDVQIQMIAPTRYVAVGKVINKSGGGDVNLTNTPVTAAVLTRRAVIATRRGASALHVQLSISPDNVGADGLLTAQARTDLGDLGNNILTTGDITNGVVVKPIIYHKGAQPEYSYIESFLIQPEVRTMSRRAVGRGI